MRKLRKRNTLDYSKVWENTVSAVARYLEVNSLESMILGISGGIDSTVAAAICKEVHRRTGKHFIGLSLPSETNGEDEITAADYVGTEFCEIYTKFPITDAFEAARRLCDIVNGETPALSLGNIKARLRMITLFDASAKHKGIVIDTDNISENTLGFYTIFGDQGTLGPIAGLWKHEVYEFAAWIKDNIYPDSEALKASISLIPTDGNGVAAGGDMGQIAPGMTYTEVDDILYCYLDAVNKASAIRELKTRYPADIVDMVIKRHQNSRFKRYHIPLVVDPETGDVLQNDHALLTETI